MKDTTPQAVQACHELILWLIPQLDKFPRSRRFTLGERLETILLEILELLVEAAFSRDADKRVALKRTNLRLEVARHLWRLAHKAAGNIDPAVRARRLSVVPASLSAISRASFSPTSTSTASTTSSRKNCRKRPTSVMWTIWLCLAMTKGGFQKYVRR